MLIWLLRRTQLPILARCHLSPSGIRNRVANRSGEKQVVPKNPFISFQIDWRCFGKSTCLVGPSHLKWAANSVLVIRVTDYIHFDRSHRSGIRMISKVFEVLALMTHWRSTPIRVIKVCEQQAAFHPWRGNIHHIFTPRSYSKSTTCTQWISNSGFLASWLSRPNSFVQRFLPGQDATEIHEPARSTALAYLRTQKWMKQTNGSLGMTNGVW